LPSGVRGATGEDLKGGSRVRPFGARLLGILTRGIFCGVFRGLSKLPG
jgi:hypothetical protein